jgi:hypothetical protein
LVESTSPNEDDAPEQVKAMKEHLQKLKDEGIEAIED